MGVGSRHQGKHMKGRHQCSRRSPWASRKGSLGKARGTALPRGLVQSLGLRPAPSHSALFALFAHLCVSMGFCSSLECLDLPASGPFLWLSGPHCLQPSRLHTRPHPAGSQCPSSALFFESFNSQRDSEVEKTRRMIQLHTSVFSQKPGQALGGGWKLHHFPGKLYYSPISWARPLRPEALKSARSRPHSTLSGIGMSASGSSGWASATTPRGSVASSKPNPEAPKSPLLSGPHHLASPREPKLGPRPCHLCRLTQGRRGIRGRRSLSQVPGRLASAHRLTGSPGSRTPLEICCLCLTCVLLETQSSVP